MLSASGRGFLVTFVISFVIFTVSVLLFWILRRRYKRVYIPRCYRYLNKEDDYLELPSEPKTFFDSIREPFTYSLTWLELNRGLDAVIHQRFIRNTIIFCTILTFFSFIVTIPINASGPNKSASNGNDNQGSSSRMGGSDNSNSNDNGNSTSDFRILGMGNIPRSDAVLWYHAVMSLIITLGSLVYWYYNYRFYYHTYQKYRLIETQDHCSVMAKDFKFDRIPGMTIEQKTISLYSYYDSLFPGRVRQVKLVRDDEELRSRVKEIQKDKSKYDKAIYEKEHGKNPQHRPKLCGKKVDSIPFYEEKLQTDGNFIQQHQAETSPRLCNIAFITFASPQDAIRCMKLKEESLYPELRYVVAPQFGGVHWSKLHLSKHSKIIRRIIAFLVVYFMVFFWAIPVAAVQTLGNINEISKSSSFGWLATAINAMGGVVSGFIESYLPAILLIILSALIIPIIKGLTYAEGRRSLVYTKELIFGRYYLFLLLNVFLVTTLAGSALNKIKSIADGSESIPNLLAQSLANQGEFFVAYVITKIGLMGIGQLLRPGFLIITAIKLKYFAKTRDEKLATMKVGFFNYETALPWTLLLLQISLVYSLLFPFLLFWSTLYFAIYYWFSQYNIIYVYQKPFECEGKIWQRMYNYFFVSLVIFHLVMIGYFALNSTSAYIIPIISLIITVIAAFYIRYKIERDFFRTFEDMITKGLFSRFSNGEEKVIQCSPQTLARTDPERPFTPVKDYYLQPDMVPLSDILGEGPSSGGKGINKIPDKVVGAVVHAQHT